MLPCSKGQSKMRNVNVGKKLSFVVISLSVLVFAIFCYSNRQKRGEESFHLLKATPPDDVVTLFLHVTPVDSGFSVEAKLKSQTTSFEVEAFPAEKVRAFLDVTSESSKHKYEEVATLLQQYGQSFFEPIETFILQCTEIEFVLADDKLIQYPFDLLLFQGKPLFVQKPVAYSFEEVGAGKFDLKKISNALLISDETADPQRAVEKVRQYFKKSTYKDINEVKPADLKTAGLVDLLLISAHGHIFDNDDDYMEFDEEHLRAKDLASLNPKLVYFDSCFMGASCDFIRLFRDNSVSFYAAPWIPNEAGNSSTKTICLFFEALDLYGCPVYAMYLTRRQLFEHFLKNDIDFMVLFRSFPFRVYRFADGSL